MDNWRLLQADEIELRVGQKTKDGSKISLLLYKDARCDMARLDEQFGVFGWQREHKDVHGVSYCGVSLRDPETGEWITKWDAGEKSSASPEKGEASDAFKRACVNWGIGRELYSAPPIWLPSTTNVYNLSVSKIGYNSKREIAYLVITARDGSVVYTFGKPLSQNAPAAPVNIKGGAIYPAKDTTQQNANNAARNEEFNDMLDELRADMDSLQDYGQLIALMKSDRVSKSPYAAALKQAGHNFAKQKGWEK